MKKNLFLIKALALILFLSLLAGCGELHEGVGAPSEGVSLGEETTGKEEGTTDIGEEIEEFTVSLVYGGKAYIPKSGGVRWSDGKSVHEAEFGEDGIARIAGLDGDYQVTLTELPKNYT